MKYGMWILWAIFLGILVVGCGDDDDSGASTDSDADSDADGDADSDSDGDSDTGTETNTESESETETATETDSNTETETEDAPSGDPCDDNHPFDCTPTDLETCGDDPTIACDIGGEPSNFSCWQNSTAAEGEVCQFTGNNAVYCRAGLTCYREVATQTEGICVKWCCDGDSSCDDDQSCDTSFAEIINEAEGSEVVTGGNLGVCLPAHEPSDGGVDGTLDAGI